MHRVTTGNSSQRRARASRIQAPVHVTSIDGAESQIFRPASFEIELQCHKKIQEVTLRKVAAVSLFAFLATSVLAADYKITKKIPIPGQGTWDYLSVDVEARRLYVSHGTQVEVLDLDSRAIVGSIPKTPGVHGIAIAPELGRGFVSNGQASPVTIFALKTLKAIADVPTGRKPDAIIYDPATSRVFAFNGGSNSATAIQAGEGRVAGPVDLGGGPEYAGADGSGYVYDNLEDESLVLKIDARWLKVEQRWTTVPCASPARISMERSTRRLFIGCRSKVMAVMNADTG